MWINVNISKERLDFLNLVIHEDAVQNLSGAVNWCIDACQRIEKKYRVDACYVAWNDIRLPENNPANEPNAFFNNQEVSDIGNRYDVYCTKCVIARVPQKLFVEWFEINYPIK